MINYFDDCKTMEELGIKRQELIVKSQIDSSIKVTEVNGEYSKRRKMLLTRKLNFKQIVIYSETDIKLAEELPVVSPFDLEVGKCKCNVIEILSNNIVLI